jgi:hypothetical protein
MFRQLQLPMVPVRKLGLLVRWPAGALSDKQKKRCTLAHIHYVRNICPRASLVPIAANWDEGGNRVQTHVPYPCMFAKTRCRTRHRLPVRLAPPAITQEPSREGHGKGPIHVAYPQMPLMGGVAEQSSAHSRSTSAIKHLQLSLTVQLQEICVGHPNSSPATHLHDTGNSW